MKRAAPWVACILGIAALAFLLPLFDRAQPTGISITRREARAVADAEARRIGIPVDQAWAATIWQETDILNEELNKDLSLRDRAKRDSIVGPRLAYFNTIYFRPGLEKNPSFGEVLISRTGNVIGARRRARLEERGGKPSPEALRQRADVIVRSLPVADATRATFVEARPNALNSRTDHTFRYRVAPDIPLGRVALYIHVYFIGHDPAGWLLIEEYADGSQFRGEFGAGLAETFIQYGVLFAVLVTLLVIFLRKYHAGEVGVGGAAFLFGTSLILNLLLISMDSAESSVFTQFGGVDARNTAIALGGFRFLFIAIPMAVLVSVGWAVGESYARERWGEKLASFDALVRREPLNATAGWAVLKGLLMAPAIAASALLPAWIGIRLGYVQPIMGVYSFTILGSSGGSLTTLTSLLIDAITIPVVAMLFVLALAHRSRMLWLGIIAALVVGTAMGAAEPQVEPQLRQLLLGFGGVAACIAVFLRVDVLASVTALFSGSLLLGFLPFLRAAEGSALVEPAATMCTPLAILLGYAVAGIATKRHIAYEPFDVAPHVKRIIERERVKAEIDAANRIQAALLPSSGPDIAGASVASHYRSATEIGGDYFDFLPLPNGEVGLAFGDVAGHGLTSGIVMAMAKAALLVQVGYDPSPRRVMEVLNETVIKTAPKRMMMTFFFGVLDPLAQQLRFSSAGHLDPYVYRAADGSVRPLSAWGFPLGVRRRDPFREITVKFEPGDRLILYSDGLIEAVDDDGEPFGFVRFEKVLARSGERSADDIKHAILDSVKRFTRNRPPEDDQTLVVLSFEEIEAAHLFREERVAATAGLPN